MRGTLALARSRNPAPSIQTSKCLKRYRLLHAAAAEMEDVQGLDLQDHWREVGNMYSEIIDETSTFRLFFDFHALLGCLFGDQKSSATKLLDSLTAFTEDCDKAYPENSQGQILRGYGLDLFLISVYPSCPNRYSFLYR